MSNAFQTKVLHYDDQSIGQAADLILGGQVVAMPTETVYGLAADATNGAAVARIYEAKGRPAFNPLIVHVPGLEQALEIGAFDGQALALAQAHWPGPLTLVVPRLPGSNVSALVTAGLATIALRVPSHPAMQDLLKVAEKPLSAPSANVSGSISPTRAEHVLKSLGGRIPLIVDAGPCERGLESTIIASTGGPLRLLRRGPIQIDGDEGTGGSIEAPGQLASHYAPSKPLRMNAQHSHADEYLIGFGEIAGEANLSPEANLTTAAANLFELLHRADASLKPRIAVAPIPKTGLGEAINDRLLRAAAPR